MVDGRQLYGERITNDTSLAIWNKQVERWRTGTAQYIEEEFSLLDASDFLDTIGLMAADIIGSYNRAHNDQRLALERQLKNLQTLRERVEREADAAR